MMCLLSVGEHSRSVTHHTAQANVSKRRSVEWKRVKTWIYSRLTDRSEVGEIEEVRCSTPSYTSPGLGGGNGAGLTWYDSMFVVTTFVVTVFVVTTFVVMVFVVTTFVITSSLFQLPSPRLGRVRVGLTFKKCFLSDAQPWRGLGLG